MQLFRVVNGRVNCDEDQTPARKNGGYHRTCFTRRGHSLPALIRFIHGPDNKPEAQTSEARHLPSACPFALVLRESLVSSEYPPADSPVNFFRKDLRLTSGDAQSPWGRAVAGCGHAVGQAAGTVQDRRQVSVVLADVVQAHPTQPTKGGRMSAPTPAACCSDRKWDRSPGLSGQATAADPSQQRPLQPLRCARLESRAKGWRDRRSSPRRRRAAEEFVQFAKNGSSARPGAPARK